MTYHQRSPRKQVQSSLPDINLSHLSHGQRRIIDALTKSVVGITLTWVSISQIVRDLDKAQRRLKGLVEDERSKQ